MLVFSCPPSSIVHNQEAMTYNSEQSIIFNTYNTIRCKPPKENIHFKYYTFHIGSHTFVSNIFTYEYTVLTELFVIGHPIIILMRSYSLNRILQLTLPDTI